MNRYKVAGEILRCTHCAFEGFKYSNVQLNTAFLSFLDLEWLNESARVFNCQKCGKLEWFSSNAEITELEDSGELDASIDTDCLACDGVILAGTSECHKCGWSYTEF